MDWQTNQRMIGLKRSLQELVIAETLDLERINAERAEYLALRAQERSDNARAQAEYEERKRRRKELETRLRATAQELSKQELANVCQVDRRSYTRERLIDMYVSMRIPPSL